MYVCSKFVIIVYKFLVVHIRFSALGCHLKWCLAFAAWISGVKFLAVQFPHRSVE